MKFLQRIVVKKVALNECRATYQTILLLANKYISEKSFQKIVELARSGAKILLYKNMPQDVPGFYNLKERKTAFQQLMNELTFRKTNDITKAAIGKGFFAIGDDVDDLLTAAGVLKETMSNKGLQFARRKNADGYTYFINNRTNKSINDWVPLTKSASSIALFDAMTGKSGLAKYTTNNSNAQVEVMAQLPPFASLIVQTYNTKKAGISYPYINTNREAETIEGDWTVTFLNGGPAIPATYKSNTLSSWTEQRGDAYKNFSGTAKYSVSFIKPEGKATAWLLDLGKVNETAEVVLNGKKIGTLIGPDFKIVIPAADIKQTNTLEITVASLMANRIIYMDKNNIPWKKFYNINMSAKKRENLKNGIFDASAWQPLPSGLSGPVTLTPLTFQLNN